MAPDDVTAAADLLERLLTDREFRAEFRRSPAASALKAGLPELARNLDSSGDPLQTLEIRESKSSLAGLIMAAAAAEGFSVSDLADLVRGGGALEPRAATVVQAALNRPSLQSIAAVSKEARANLGKEQARRGIQGGSGQVRPSTLSGVSAPTAPTAPRRAVDPPPTGESESDPSRPSTLAGLDGAPAPSPDASDGSEASSPSPPPLTLAGRISEAEGQPEAPIDNPETSRPETLTGLAGAEIEEPPAENTDSASDGPSAGPPQTLAGLTGAAPEELPEDSLEPADEQPPATDDHDRGSQLAGPESPLGSEDSQDAGRESAVFAALGEEEQASSQPRSTLHGLQSAVPGVDGLLGQDYLVAGGFAIPIAPEYLNNTNAGGHLHGSEFAIPDAEGAVGLSGERLHAGYDLFAEDGAPVQSPVGGVIVEVKASRGNSGQIFGGVVKVRAADGHVWVFRHVDPVDVAEGQEVLPGQLIAAVTPWRDGPSHAHIELWRSLEGGYRLENMLDPHGALQAAYSGQPVELLEHGHEHAAEGIAALPDELADLADVDLDVGALLENPNIVVPPELHESFEAGTVDPRLVGILSKLSERYEIELGVFGPGQAELAAGSEAVRHVDGLALDIVAINGSPIDELNLEARDLVEELASLEDALRPDQIGSPWSIDAEGFFTDSDHVGRLHLAFDEPLPPPEVVSDDAVGGEVLPESTMPVALDGPEVSNPSVGRQSAAFAALGPENSEEQAPRSTVQFLRAVEPESDPSRFVVPGGFGVYPGDDAPKQQIALWMARAAQQAGLPPELPVMAALVESGLFNHPGGHADSVGYFQMRLSIWNQGEYAGYPENPGLQLKWFLDQAVALKQKRLAQGLADLGEDPSGWGEWIADVERPAAQYRHRYQERLAEARELIFGPGATS